MGKAVAGDGAHRRPRRRSSRNVNILPIDENQSYHTGSGSAAGFEDDQFSHHHQHVDQDFLDRLSRETVERLQREEEEELRRRDEELQNVLFQSPDSVPQPQPEGRARARAQSRGRDGGGESNDDDETHHHHVVSSNSEGEGAEDEGRPSTRALKSTLFTKHFRKEKAANQKRGQPEVFDVYCNYCDKKYKFTSGNGYGTYRRHIMSKHSKEQGISSNQTQTPTILKEVYLKLHYLLIMK